MRVIRFLNADGKACFGADIDGKTAELLDGDPFGNPTHTGQVVPVVHLLAPVSPPNIFGIGLNYREHVRQSGQPVPELPVMFMKPTTTVTDPGRPILVPSCCKNGPEVDYECELAVVIGKTARNVPEEKALDYVFGYTAANEITARKWAKQSRTRGKCFDGFCPIGPAVVTADEVPDPQALALSTILNGTEMQRGNTEDMIFPVAELISFVSQDTTLLPGTIILTGTPPGAGFSRNPPVFLKPGDVVSVEIEGIGKLTNPVEQGSEELEAAA